MIFLKNILAKREIAHTEQILPLSQCFQLDSIIIVSYVEISQTFVKLFSNSFAADLLYVVNGPTYTYLQHLT